MKKIIYTLLVLGMLSACSKDEGSLKLKVSFAREQTTNVKVNFYQSEEAKKNNDVFMFKYFNFENTLEVEQLVEAIPIGDYYITTSVTIDSVDFTGEVQVNIAMGEEDTATLAVQGNGSLNIIVRSSNNIALGGAKVYLYETEDDMLAENYIKLQVTDRNTPSNGTVFRNLPFDDYYVTAKWRSDPTANYLIGNKTAIWVNKDEDVKKSVTVVQ